MESGNDREVNLSLRLSGREVYKAVKNFIKDEMGFDPREQKDAAIAAAREAAGEAAREYLKANFVKPFDIEWFVRSVVNKMVVDESDKLVRDAIRESARSIVKESNAKIVSAVRAEFEASGAEIVAKLVRDAMTKGTAKK